MGTAEMRTAGQNKSGTETGMPLEPNTAFAVHSSVGKETRKKWQLRSNLTHMLQGEVLQQHIPIMLYADAIVLLANNQTDVKWLINISDEEAIDIGLNFSAEKSGIMVFNDTSTDAASIQHDELPRVK